MIDALVACPTFDDAVARVTAVHDFETHPYLLWMQAPETSRAPFRRSQVHFRHAVDDFSRALAATLARIPELPRRIPLSANVAEEHGHGSLRQTHGHSFRAWLDALGVTDEELALPCPIGVTAFNAALVSSCLAWPAEGSAAALGIIEHSYVGVSRTIARVAHERSWVAPGEQDHYGLHEVLDVTHAADLLAVARPGWERDPRRVARGLALGAHWFWRLYDDLL